MARTKNVSFYGNSRGPLGGDKIQRDYANDPRRTMFNTLKGVGNVQSPMEGMLKALNMGVDGYFAGQAKREMLDREDAQSDAMMKVLSGMGGPDLVDGPGTPPDPRYKGDVPASGLQGGIDAGMATGNKDILPYLQQMQIQKYGNDQALALAGVNRKNEIDDLATKQTNKMAQIAAQNGGKAPPSRNFSMPGGQIQPQQLVGEEWQPVGAPYARKNDPVPGTITTAEGVYIKNPDGTTGARLGSPAAQYGFGAAPQQPPSTPPAEVGGGSVIPVSPNKPWGNVPLRDQGKMQIGIRKAANSSIGKQKEALKESKLLTSRLKRFKYLNSKTETGGWDDRATDVSLDPYKREMVSIVDSVTPLMRQGLPGAASERDTAMFRNATVGLGQERSVNNNIVTGIVTSNDLANDYVSFQQEYLQANGHLEGMDQYWGQYLEANPIFDPASPEGSYDLNEKRVAYQRFFGGNSNKGPVSEMNFDAQGNLIP